MTTDATQPYHFSPEQRTQLGQVYRLILGWRQERLAAQARQAGQDGPACDLPIADSLPVEGVAKRKAA